MGQGAGQKLRAFIFHTRVRNELVDKVARVEVASGTVVEEEGRSRSSK